MLVKRNPQSAAKKGRNMKNNKIGRKVHMGKASQGNLLPTILSKSKVRTFAYIQGDPLQTVELLHHKKIFNNGQKKSPLLHIDQNMTPFIILKKIFLSHLRKWNFYLHLWLNRAS